MPWFENGGLLPIHGRGREGVVGPGRNRDDFGVMTEVREGQSVGAVGVLEESVVSRIDGLIALSQQSICANH